MMKAFIKEAQPRYHSHDALSLGEGYMDVIFPGVTQACHAELSYCKCDAVLH